MSDNKCIIKIKIDVSTCIKCPYGGNVWNNVQIIWFILENYITESKHFNQTWPDENVSADSWHFLFLSVAHCQYLWNYELTSNGDQQSKNR